MSVGMVTSKQDTWLKKWAYISDSELRRFVGYQLVPAKGFISYAIHIHRLPYLLSISSNPSERLNVNYAKIMPSGF